MLLQELSRSRVFETLREMERLQGRFNQLLESPWRGSPEFPPLNVWISEDAAHVTAELPGVEAEDIEISVVNDTLTLRGSRKPDELKEGESLHRRERGFGQFTRTIQLPFKVDSENVQASNKKGILCITLPRTEQDRPRKIAVRGE
jgi:HSP20 family protein